MERQTKRLASEGTQFLPTCERPAKVWWGGNAIVPYLRAPGSFKRMLGSYHIYRRVLPLTLGELA